MHTGHWCFGLPVVPAGIGAVMPLQSFAMTSATSSIFPIHPDGSILNDPISHSNDSYATVDGTATADTDYMAALTEIITQSIK